MKKWNIYKDRIKWNNYLVAEAKIKFLKSVIKDSKIDSIEKIKSAYVLNKKFWWMSKVQVVNWCIITGRSHSVLQDFWLSRMQLKDLASDGFFPGLKWRNF